MGDKRTKSGKPEGTKSTPKPPNTTETKPTARPATLCGDLPNVPRLDARERATLAAIRAGAKGIGGIQDRLNGSHGTSAVNRCLAALIDYGLITGPAEGPWVLTDAAKSVDHKPHHRDDSDRGRSTIVTATPQTATRPEAIRCAHGRTVHCPHCMGVLGTVPGASGVGPSGVGSYSEMERMIKTPQLIIVRTSDTLLF